MKSGVYGNSPFTLQTRGCGEPGDYIQISPDFITDYTAIQDTFGPPGQVFVHEFAKLRYGVFEEFGYPGDTKYPMFYYKAVWTVNGQENKIMPNFCTNTELTDYSMVDLVTGNRCSYDEGTGLPDVNCVAQIGPDNMVKSSIMALPFLVDNDQFCDDSEALIHQDEIPTKHNDMCGEESTFAVIQRHADFKGYTVNNTISSRDTSFEILRSKASASFVMVLDVSGSMDDNCGGQSRPPCEYRIDRMKQSAIRWVKYDLRNEVELSLVKFSTKAQRIEDLTAVTDATRPNFIKSLSDLRTGGGTCLGAALRGGLKALRDGGVPEGSVMIFLTDGEHSCDGPDKSKIADVIPEVKRQGVRVITIAFSDNADENILSLAKETDGKAYFVPDNTGPEVINSALQGSLTYQPSVPSNDIDIIVYEQTFQSMESFEFDFTIDEMIGKNVSVQIDVSGNPGIVVTIDSESLPPFTEKSGVFLKEYDELPAGDHHVKVYVNGNSKLSFASVKVTAKARNATIPIMTNCWSSLDNEKADLATGVKVAVIAKVMQGSNPVIGAKVTAYIERDGVSEPLEIPLLDSGSAPDNVANDGLYARYFTTFTQTAENTRYSLKCQVESTANSNINQGFLDARKFGGRRSKRSLPRQPSANNPICCGSNTLREDSVLKPTGQFKRSAAGGAIEIENADKAAYPPGEVSDLKGANNLTAEYFTLTFTSAGKVLDSGTASNFQVYYTNNVTQLKSESTIMDSLPFLLAANVSNSETLLPQIAGTPVEVKPFKAGFDPDTQYFFRIATFGGSDDSMHTWSNIARVYLGQPAREPDDSLSGGAIAGIVIGSFAAVLVVAAAAFLYKKYHWGK